MSDCMRHGVASVDAAWLRMDEPGNLMVINGVIMFDRPMPFEQFRDDIVRKRLVAHIPRLRQKIVPPPLPFMAPQWEEDTAFDLDYHVQLAPLEHADQPSLQQMVGTLMSERFDPARPLWRYYFVPDYEGGCAVVARYHHCIGDGLALLYVLLKMTDAAQGDESTVEMGQEDAGWWDRLMRPISRAWSLTRTVEEAVLHEVAELLKNPAKALDLTRDVSNGAGAAGKLLLMSSDPQTAFKGPLSTDKRAVWSQPIPVSLIKEIAHVTGSKINDVVLAAVAGALRQYLKSRNESVEDVTVRAVVPVNLRPIEQAAQLGNRFGLVFVPLPLGIEEPLDRIFEVRKRTSDIKHSPEALLTFQILRTLGITPSPAFEAVVSLFGMRSTAVMTNVIGPREPLTMAGRKLSQLMFWVPCSGHLGMGVSIFSYTGNLWVGIATDAGLVPDPEMIVKHFQREIADMTQLAMQVKPEVAVNLATA